MARAKRGVKARRRRNRMRQHAQGYRGGRSRLWKAMAETVRHAWRYATVHRRERKRDFRRLWIIRINAAARQLGVRYSSLVHALSRAHIRLDRKILADLAISDPTAFRTVLERAGLLPAQAA
ncbi:MAG: 50S ribosomal protein L20 [Myxococcales bacterium]|nr:50S ribosomal protein L20 [Myxococcota bacterium]MDW8282070.1 50S ribosomal protein L20 [Myxococcales bacterium]